MKHFLLVIVTLFAITCIYSANWEWVTSCGAGDLDRVWDMAVDLNGNIYVTGEFVDTLQIGNCLINGWGLSDIFVAKFTPTGVPIWAKAFGGSGGDTGLSIDTDALGNCYITGYYMDTAHFEEQTLISQGGWDIFILKLNTFGEKLWAYSEGGLLNDIGYGLAVMPDGRCFVTGWFADAITFHDNTTLSSYGGSDIYTFAANTDGILLWKRHAGSAGVEYGYKIAVDFYGNSYVTGSAGLGSNFDGIYLSSGGAFIAGYDVNGIIRWVNCASGAGVNSIAVDTQPSLIEQFGTITGRYTGTAVLGNQTLNSIDGTDDAYTAVFQLLTGQWTTVYSGGGTGSDKGRACTYKGHPYYTGSFEDTADLFGFNAVSAGASDGYVLSTAYGTDDWLLTFGGTNNDTPVDVGVDGAGNVFICGWYSGLARFGANLFIHSGNDSDLDFFVAKINVSTSNEDSFSPLLTQRMKCFPNPFRTKITIELPLYTYTSDNAVSIYNIKGEKVNTILPITDGTDVEMVVWNGFDSNNQKCPSGIYLIKDMCNHAKVAKVLLLD